MIEDTKGSSEYSRFLARLFFIVAVVVISGDVLLVLLHPLAKFDLLGLPREFPMLLRMDAECNIPSWYASMLWLLVSLAALACFAIEKYKQMDSPARWFWLIICAVFLAASADEIAQIHEVVGELMSETIINARMISFVPDAITRSLAAIFYAPAAIWFAIYLVRFARQRMTAVPFLWQFFFMSLVSFILSVGMDFYQVYARTGHHLLGLTDTNRSALPFYDETVFFEEFLEDLGASLIFLSFFGYSLSLAGAGLLKWDGSADSGILVDADEARLDSGGCEPGDSSIEEVNQ